MSCSSVRCGLGPETTVSLDSNTARVQDRGGRFDSGCAARGVLLVGQTNLPSEWDNIGAIRHGGRRGDGGTSAEQSL